MSRIRIPLLFGASLAAAGCSLIYDPQIPEGEGPPPISGTVDVGYLYVGPVGDHGWTKTHDDGRLYLESQLGDAVSTHYAPSVAAPDAEAVIDEFVMRGDDVIIGTSFDFLQAITTAALRYPDRRFLICSGFQTGPNLGSYFGRMELALYQAGVLAGRMTTTDRIGLVGPVVIPESVRHMNAFTRGVRSVNPAARVLVRWTNSWFDPDEETDATNELVDAGADVIFGQTDTPVPIQVSATRTTASGAPVYSIGYDNPDSCDFAPDRCLTSAFWNWGPMMTRIVSDMRDGTWLPNVVIYDQMEPDRAESVVYLSEIDPGGPVPTAVRLEVEGLVSELTRDTPESRYYPFRGPVVDNQGGQRIAPGALPSDTDLLRMCWFSEGIYELDGTTPAEVPAGCVGTR